MEKNKKNFTPFIVFGIFILMMFSIVKKAEINQGNKKMSLNILSSTENADIEDLIYAYAQDNKINLTIEYAGNLDIIDKINNKEEYDAVWVSNSMWYYMLDNSNAVTNAKSISINPVVFGINKSKAMELGFINKDVYTKDILKAIENKKLEFVITSPTRTNTGATAYLGFLSTLLDNPEVITLDMLKDEKLREDVRTLFSGVNRVSGSDEFLEDMFLNGEYEAIVSYETSIININRKLEQAGKEPLYLVYPVDGVAINDSSFAFIDNGLERSNAFQMIQGYLLSEEFQEELIKTGRRVWFGGTNDNAPKDIFKKEWGIDTTKYLNAINFPSKEVISYALALYQAELRKPSHTVFILDYSGSMYGEGKEELVSAMEYILTPETASTNLLQFSYRDKITVIPFSTDVLDTWYTEDGADTKDLLEKIQKLAPVGGTNIYDSSIKALEILSEENQSIYNISAILMTDGESNNGYLWDLETKYRKLNLDIPIYSITFGLSNDTQLKKIANLTNGKVFDGKTNLLEAFKEVRGYN